MEKHEYDHSYRDIFSQKQVVRDLLSGFIPAELSRLFDLDTLEPCKNVFVEQDHSENYKERRNDLVWKVRFNKEWLFVYILIEFQSAPDKYMALRMMVYMGLLYQELLKSGQISEKELLPPVLPVVIYNGQRKWNAPLQMDDLINPTPIGFEMFRPRLEYFLLDEQRTDETIGLKEKNLVAAIIALEKTRSRENLYKLLILLTEWFDNPEQKNVKRVFSHWFKRAILQKKHTEYKINENIDKMAEENTMFADTVQIWVDEWLEEGEIKGEIKGEIRGKVLTLLEMAEDGEICYEKAVKKITPFRSKLENPSFWQDIDQRLEKLKGSE
jgi:predicted transposase/invertase (TIGR01784 family)